jgi:hypothetical protein
MKLEANIDDKELTLTIDNKIVRKIVVSLNTPYNFKHKQEDCYFIVEKNFKKTFLYLYPINLFSPNKLLL